MWYEPVYGAILFGIITIIIGHVSGFLVHKLHKSTIPPECADWNKNHIMEKTLFLTGAITWLISFMYAKWMIKAY